MAKAQKISLLDNIQQIVDGLEKGQFVEGMERFYAPDVINEEPTGESVQGLDTIISNEQKFLEGVSAFHGVTVKSVGVGEDDGKGNGVTFAEYSIRADLKDGSKFNPDQVQVTHWRDGKAVRNTFYYNPSF